MEVTGPNTRMNLDRRHEPPAAAPPASAQAVAGRSPRVRALLAFAVLATLVWLVAVPSTPALIAVVSSFIAVIGWGDGPDHDPSV